MSFGAAPLRASRTLLMIILVPLLLTQCARLEYVKVPTPTQYSVWTDEKQRAADALEGVRYYLPRPFLHLKQSVPVAQRVAFVSFALKQEEGVSFYEIALPESAPTWLLRAAPRRISVTQVLATALRSPSTGTGDLESTDPDNSAEKEDQASVDTAPRPPSELTARTGFISDTDPVTRLGDRMDIVYLPDFEEQYVIQPHVGLGRADIETRLRNGWAAEIFSQKVNNSDLIPYVIRQVERASEAAAGIASTWSSLKSSASKAAAALGDSSGELESQEAAERTVDHLGEVVLFKVAEVKFAQPGVYPILKPREIRQWFGTTGIVSGADPQATFELYLQQAQAPWVRPDMAFIPCPPFTMVGFNVTTDIFLAPADRAVEYLELVEVVDAQESNQRNDSSEFRQAAETIERLLKPSLIDDNSHFNPEDIEVAPERGGSHTRITLNAKVGIQAPPEEERGGFVKFLQEMIGSALRANADIEIQVSEGTLTSITATIAQSAQEIAAGAIR